MTIGGRLFKAIADNDIYRAITTVVKIPEETKYIRS